MSRKRKGPVVAMKRGSFRETIRKTVALLTRDQVEVLFRGFQPCVITQGDKIVRMVLPEVGDDAPEELIEAMHGFLDHECGHIFYTPFGRAAQLGRGSSIKACLLNIVEDIRLEKLLPRDLPGTKDNLERMYERMIDKFWGEPIQKQIAAGTPADRMLSVCIVVSFRALAGQKVFQTYMDKHSLWPYMAPLLARYPDLSKDLSSLETYDDVVACVEKVLASLEPKQKQQMDDDAKAQAAQQQDQDDSAPPQQGQSDDTDDESEDQGEGEPGDEADEGEPQDSKGAGSDESEEEDADNGDGDGEGSDAGDDEGNSSEGDEADEGEGGAGEDGDEEGDGDAGDGEGDDDSEDEADKKSKGGKGHGDGEGEDDESDEEGGKCKGDPDGDPNPDHDGDGDGEGADTDEMDDSDSSGGGKSNRTITDAVKSLDATSRRVLYLHKKKRRSIEKIATDMNMSEDEVKSILGQARRKLAEYMMGDK